jgi:lipopolysaccharide/colanic/teichoic acid biosynthesis glycosyltransferase
MLLIALAICLDSPGPALFIQERVGEGGRLFKIFKFRTMANGSTVRLSEQHKRRDDDRITRVGRVLRKTSLDELPQLLNVFLGQMSLVGPRPEIPAIVLARYQPWQYRRFLAPQGMTGWWQVTGRGSKLLYEHTEDDLYYIEHASFRFDLRILVKTVGAVIRRDGAF